MTRVGIGTAGSIDPGIEGILRRFRKGLSNGLTDRELTVELATAGSFLAAAIALPLLSPPGVALDPLLALTLCLAYAATSRVAFSDGVGYTVPTQLVFVPMLFWLPVQLVPMLVAGAILLGHVPDYLAGRRHPARSILVPGDAWHALGPAIVLTAAGSTGFDGAQWPIYAAALGAQFVVDHLTVTARAWIALGVAPAAQPRLGAWVYGIDTLLAVPAALAAAQGPYAFLMVLPLVVLLGIFAREREGRIEAALELSQAYRGTAMVLGDVLEESDEYTGSHSRSVVSLALQVAHRMGLDERQRRNVEFGALLHDVGKIAIPAEIINKPGPLDDQEWELMRTHTIEGQRMLDRVGGVLAEVGTVVRASHERWDGRGYPDGLAEDQIPIAASVVSCCDAFNAMTTDRSYRLAMTVEEAIAELRANSGTQFRPDVVDTLIAVVAATIEPARALATA